MAGFLKFPRRIPDKRSLTKLRTSLNKLDLLRHFFSKGIYPGQNNNFLEKGQRKFTLGTIINLDYSKSRNKQEQKATGTQALKPT